MSQPSCCICHTALFRPEIETETLRCGHALHHNCRVKIRNGLCPNCRQPIRQPIKMYLNYEPSDEEAQTSEMVSAMKKIRAEMDAVIAMLKDPNDSVILPTQGNQNTSATHSDREEHVVMVPIPWQIRGQSRIKFQLVNNELQISLSRRR